MEKKLNASNHLGALHAKHGNVAQKEEIFH